MRRRSDPIFGSSLRERIAAGAVRVRPEIARFVGDTVVFSDGAAERFAAVVWATGFRNAYPWLQVEGALDESGQPLHDRGRSPVPGLAFLGLPWQRARSSALVMGAGRDAAWLVEQLLPMHQVSWRTPPRAAGCDAHAAMLNGPTEVNVTIGSPQPLHAASSP
jgi:putative flavoprotein involved in K+ transport